jgi:sugar phosphate isomerase/epimerase
MYSRRDFGRVALVALPLARALAIAKIDSKDIDSKKIDSKKIDSKIDGVQLGVQSYSFRDLPLDAAIQAMAADGLGQCELFSPHIEEGHTDRAPIAAVRPQGAAARSAARDELRKWRLSVPMDYFVGIKKKFNDAGIDIYAYNYSFRDDFTDEEIDRGFDFAKALGARFITASTTLSTVKRVAPFAEKHRMVVAMHGHSNLKDPNEFATPQSFAQAMGMSKYFKVNLDIGHFTAANFDAVDYIEKNHDNIVLIHLKDRKKDEGPNTPWGEGDTPIKQVLLLLKQKHYAIPAFIEYEYKGAGNSQQEVLKCYQWAKRVLEAD